MKNGLYARAWWLALMCVSSSLGVEGQCAYNTTMCTCTFQLIKCSGLTKPPELLESLNDGNWTKIDFWYGNLTTLPALPPGIKYVSFYYVPLTQLSDLHPSATLFNSLTIYYAAFKRLPEAFQKLQNLTELVIRDTPMEDWDNKTLASLGRSLNELYLENVTMNQWPPGFSQLTLNGLGISKVPLSSIPDGAFSNMTDLLSWLEMSYLRVASIPSSLFALRNLTWLSLKGNKLADVKSVFDLMSSSPLVNTLNSLHAASMGLTRLPDLSNFTSLTDVDFQKNPISTIDIDSLPSTLTSFNCSECLLSSIPSQTQRLNLIYLELSTNKIKTVDLDSIPATVTSLNLNENNITELICQDQNKTTSLESLYLQHNLLSAIPECIQNLSRLTRLYLGYNQIADINFDNFPHNLTYLNLNENNISNISPSNSTTSSLLEKIDLSYNPIANIHPSAFVNLINLKTLQMYITQFVRLPSALTSLTALTRLSISFSGIDICQCPADTDLVQWFESRNGSLDISGYCLFPRKYVYIQDYLSGYCDRVATTLHTETETSVTLSSTTANNSGVVVAQFFVSPWFLFMVVVCKCTVLYL